MFNPSWFQIISSLILASIAALYGMSLTMCGLIFIGVLILGEIFQLITKKPQDLSRQPSGFAEPLPLEKNSSDEYDDYEGVDPVAEADVYIAYGRHAQARAILEEALREWPTRQKIIDALAELDKLEAAFQKPIVLSRE